MKLFKSMALLVLIILLSSVYTGCKKENIKQEGNKETESSNTVSESTGNPNKSEVSEDLKQPQLKYLGHSSIKLKMTEGAVIYIDPYAGDDYSEAADLLLVTHSHSDHANIDRVKLKDGGKVITYKDAFKDNKYQSFEIPGLRVTAVPAYNKNHPKDSCFGYVLEFDGIRLYHAGDTSKISEMEELSKLNITYALLPIDGVYNMGPEEAAEAAKIIGAKYNIPIHTGPDGIFSEKNISLFNVDNRIIMRPGDTIVLKE